MKLAHLAGIAALALTLGTSAAFAADEASGPTISSAMTTAGGTSESRGTYFTGLAPAYKQNLMTQCETGMKGKTLKQEEMDFCNSMPK